MARRTIHIPDELDERIRASGSIDDSFSAFAQRALRRELERGEESAREELDA